MNKIKLSNIVNHLVSFFKNRKEGIFSGSKFIFALILTNLVSVTITAWVTFYIIKKLEKAGEPNITASIESIALYRNLSSNYCDGEVVINITNIENKPTYLVIDTIQLFTNTLEQRPFSIYVDKKISLNGFEYKSDTVKFDLHEEQILAIDSFKCKSLSCNINICYPNKKIAKYVVFDTTTPRFELIYRWDKLPYLAFYQLRNQYKRNLLPRQWKKTEVIYFGTNYDCYYYTEDSSDVDIIYQGDRLKYKFANEKYYPVKDDSSISSFKSIFVPHPKIENKFINIDECLIDIAVHVGDSNKIDIVKKEIGVKRGYIQIFNIRY